MATFTAARARAGFPVAGHGFASNLKVAFGTIAIAANPPASTVFEFCKVPKGATVIGGYVQGSDIDTGTEELDIDFGWAANGDEIADTDGFGNMDVITGDPLPGGGAAGIWLPLAGVLNTAGPKTFNAETTITGLVNVDAAGGGTGILTCVVFYVLP